MHIELNTSTVQYTTTSVNVVEMRIGRLKTDVPMREASGSAVGSGSSRRRSVSAPMRSEAMEATSDTAVEAEAEGAELTNIESSNEEAEGVGPPPPFAIIGTRAGEACFDCDCRWGRGSDSGAEDVGIEHCAEAEGEGEGAVTRSEKRTEAQAEENAEEAAAGSNSSEAHIRSAHIRAPHRTKA